jgi:hypothetical protein
MKTKIINTVLLVVLILLSCAPAETQTLTVPTATLTLIAPVEASTLPAPAVLPTSPIIGYWIQIKLSEHPLGTSVCGNIQHVEFFEDGTFIETSDNSGIYDFLPPMDQKVQGTFTILSENEVEIKYSDENATIWTYILSGNSLTMSSPLPDELGGGFVPCYFSKSSK